MPESQSMEQVNRSAFLNTSVFNVFRPRCLEKPTKSPENLQFAEALHVPVSTYNATLFLL